MIGLKIKISRLAISRLFLSLLIISINIREPFFHIREMLYVLFVTTSFTYIDYKQIKFVIALVVIWMISTAYNLAIPGSDFKLNLSGLNTIIVAGYLFLICFSQARYANTIIKSYMFSASVVAIITVVLWLFCYFSKHNYSILRAYFIQLQGRTGLTFISIDLRAILGTRFLTVWYRTSPCMICALGYCLIERLNENGKHTMLILLFTIALIFSGTRANMLSAILLILVYVSFWFLKKKMISVTIGMISLIMFGTFFVASKFLNDPTSASSSIKVSDINTYQKIYFSDILRTLLFGWGPGSTFYSIGRGLTIDSTELTLLETIRRYGLVSAMVIFFYIWFQPLYIIMTRKDVKYKLFYVAVLFAFIFTACTNPYLLDSVGFCALLFYWVYFKFAKRIV